jgi:hypothetical protein
MKSNSCRRKNASEESSFEGEEISIERKRSAKRRNKLTRSDHRGKAATGTTTAVQLEDSEIFDNKA